MIPEETESARGPVYMTPVRDLYALDLGEGERIEVRRHATFLTALIHTPPGGFGDLVVLLRDGRVVQRGPLSSLESAPSDGFVRDFLDAWREAP